MVNLNKEEEAGHGIKLSHWWKPEWHQLFLTPLKSLWNKKKWYQWQMKINAQRPLTSSSHLEGYNIQHNFRGVISFFLDITCDRVHWACVTFSEMLQFIFTRLNTYRQLKAPTTDLRWHHTPAQTPVWYDLRFIALTSSQSEEVLDPPAGFAWFHLCLAAPEG